MMLMLLMSMMVAPEFPDRDADVTFARWEMFDARLVTVEIWTKAQWKDGSQLAPTLLMQRTISYRPELKLKGATKSWTSSANCPPALPALEELASLSLPKIAVSNLADSDTAIAVRADGAAYRLSIGAYYPLELGQIELSFGTATPVAAWVDNNLREFDQCWKPFRQTK